MSLNTTPGIVVIFKCEEGKSEEIFNKIAKPDNYGGYEVCVNSKLSLYAQHGPSDDPEGLWEDFIPSNHLCFCLMIYSAYTDYEVLNWKKLAKAKRKLMNWAKQTSAEHKLEIVQFGLVTSQL